MNGILLKRIPNEQTFFISVYFSITYHHILKIQKKEWFLHQLLFYIINRITFAIFILIWVIARLIQIFVVVDPIVPIIIFVGAFIASIIYWIADNKVKNIKEEIIVIEKE